MASTQAQSGHGTTIAMELDPTISPGAFTVIAELGQDIAWPGMTRPETEVTSHGFLIDQWVLGVLTRAAMTFGVNFVYNDSTHDHTTGLYASIKKNQLRGFRLRGPKGSAGTDEWIASGYVQNLVQKSPVKQGVRTADATVRFTGDMIVGGAPLAPSI